MKVAVATKRRQDKIARDKDLRADLEASGILGAAPVHSTGVMIPQRTPIAAPRAVAASASSEVSVIVCICFQLC